MMIISLSQKRQQIAVNSLLVCPGTDLSLFKINGTRVVNKSVTVKGNKKPWTIGNYLLLMKKSPSAVKIGVGYVFQSKLSSSSDDNVYHLLVAV